MKIRLVNGKILLKAMTAPREQTILTLDSEDKGKAPQYGEVVQSDDKGYKVGDNVIFIQYAPERISVDGKEFHIATPEDILAVIEP